RLHHPSGVALGSDGGLYIADSYNDRIRRVGPDGMITTVAGNGVNGYSGDGGLATEAKLYYPWDVAFGSDGSLYIVDYANNRIRRVGPDGIITTVAGTGVNGYSGDGGLATEARLYYPSGVALGSDGGLYIADWDNHRVRKVSSPLRGFSGEEIAVASEDGGALYRFSASGRHLQTIDSSTGAAHYSFTYDETGRLIEVRDVDGDLTRIERDANGGPTAIVSPDGQRTTLMLDAHGYLATVTNPAGQTHAMAYTAEGLLTAFIDAKGNSNRFEYDDLGRLIKDTDAGGGGWTLARTENADGYTSSMTTAEGRTTTFTVEPLSTGDRRQVNTYSDGTVQTKLFKTNGEETTTAPDATVTTKLEGPDPRFGVLAPVPISVTTKLPSGLTATATTA
ncbi:MAG: RHS repeat-associated core domain-containing protein, partial [Gammaproteobacteria bacterium]